MKKINILLMAVGTVVVTSCGLYQKYERPDVNTKGIIRDNVSLTDTLVSTPDSLTFGNLPWRTVFTDPQLQILIQQALDNNPDLLNAALNVQMAETQLKAARLSFLPQFTFSPSCRRNAALRCNCLPPETIRRPCRPISWLVWPICTTHCSCSTVNSRFSTICSSSPRKLGT